jgi:serine protease Do
MSVIGVILIFCWIQGAFAATETGKFMAPPSFANLADAVRHSVVNISTTQVVKGAQLPPFLGPGSPFGEFFGGNVPQKERKVQALGSGFIIDKSGLILTNNHVVEKATEIKVRLDTEKEYDAKLVGRDPKTDLALIQATPDAGFPDPVRLGDSDAMRVGDWVIAVGNPFGLGHTVTDGIISATGRIIGAGPYDDFLQTDAAINPGNSGGPLFNMEGEVIGINTAIVAQGQGIGFAIPINMAKELLPQLKAGKIIRGWLGVMIQDITPELAKSFNLKNTNGVLISDVVKNGPAAKAGLKAGDVVVRFEGKAVKDSHALSRMVANTPPDTRVSIDVIRNGKESKENVTLGTMPTEQGMQPAKEASPWG